MFCCTTILCVTTGLIGLLVFLVISYWHKSRSAHYWKTKNVKSDAPVPFVGNYLGMFSGGSTFFHEDQKRYRKFGRVFGGYEGFMPIVFVGEPELIRSIMVKDFHCFQDRRDYTANDPILSMQIPHLRGDAWKRVRSVISPAFSSGKLKKMVTLIREGAESNQMHFLSAAESGEMIDVKRLFNAFGVDVIASVVFGSRLESANDPDNIFVQNVSKILNRDFPWRYLLINMLPGVARFLGITPWNANTTEFFLDFTKDVIDKRRKQNIKRNDLLQILIDAEQRSKDGRISLVEDTKDVLPEEQEEFSNDLFQQYFKSKTISEEEFIAQCVLFFFAGLDGLAITLSMVAYNLALNPQCQEKLQQEIDELWRKHDVIGYDAVVEAAYLDQVLSETLRVAPPGVRLSREATQDYKLGETGITITKGMNVIFPVYSMHNDPELFPNPETFDPDRFSPENKDLIQPYAYLPFGAGPRHCIGMRLALLEMKLCLLVTLRKFSFEPCSKTDIPLKFFKGAFQFMPRNVVLKVVKRSS